MFTEKQQHLHGRSTMEPINLKIESKDHEITDEPRVNHSKGHPTLHNTYNGDDDDDEDIEISVIDESGEDDMEEEEREDEKDDDEDEESHGIEPMRRVSGSDYFKNMPRETENELKRRRSESDRFAHRRLERSTSSHLTPDNDLRSNLTRSHSSKSADQQFDMTSPPHLSLDRSMYLEHHNAMANYWLHLSKLYHSQLAMTSLASPTNPTHPIVPSDLTSTSAQILHKQQSIPARGNSDASDSKTHVESLPPPLSYYPGGHRLPFPHPAMLPGLPVDQEKMFKYAMKEPGEIGVRAPTRDPPTAADDKHDFVNGIEYQNKLMKHANRQLHPSYNMGKSNFYSPQSVHRPSEISYNPLRMRMPGFPFPVPPSPHSFIPEMTSLNPGGNVDQLSSAGMNMFFPPNPSNSCVPRKPRDPNKPPPAKKYKCDLCGKAFSRSNTLVTHRVSQSSPATPS